MSKNDGNLMDRRHLTAILMDAKRNRGISFEEIAKIVGRHKVWTAAAMYGQATMAMDEAKKLLQCLGLPLEKEWLDLLCAPPLRGSLQEAIPVDPVLYRFYEMLQVYGMPLKALIHEEFGDGIMSAIDFSMDIEKYRIQKAIASRLP